MDGIRLSLEGCKGEKSILVKGNSINRVREVGM